MKLKFVLKLLDRVLFLNISELEFKKLNNYIKIIKINHYYEN